jgi:hypothetical protein
MCLRDKIDRAVAYSVTHCATSSLGRAGYDQRCPHIRKRRRHKNVSRHSQSSIPRRPRNGYSSLLRAEASQSTSRRNSQNQRAWLFLPCSSYWVLHRSLIVTVRPRNRQSGLLRA